MTGWEVSGGMALVAVCVAMVAMATKSRAALIVAAILAAPLTLRMYVFALGTWP